GVRVVIDSGLSRAPRFDPRSGMTRLETLPVSRASADQRRGRAGRVEPGVCWRLWSEGEHGLLPERAEPEILAADLAPLALELAQWGAQDPGKLAWLDAPPAPALSQARDLLRRLGALDDTGRATEHGRRMAELGLHPRLAHMALKAAEMGLAPLACVLAAVLSERDVLKDQAGYRDADLRLRVEALSGPAGRKALAAHGQAVDAGACRRVEQVAREWLQRLDARPGPLDAEAAGRVLALAYPDRIARRREDGQGRFVLSNGRGALFTTPQPLASAEFLVAAELDAGERDARIYLAAPLSRADIEAVFADELREERVIAWDAQRQAVAARRRVWLERLLLRDAPLPDPDPRETARALMEGIRAEGLGILPWDKGTRSWQARVALLRQAQGEGWPDVSDAALLARLEDWLAPWLKGATSRADLQRLDLMSALKSLLPWDKARALDELAPTHYTAPSGSRIPIDYTAGPAPVVAVRLQEMFGETQAPSVAGGRVRLLLHLLSPAHRPVQITDDLASFWATTYAQVRKELRGRYPRHAWPEDPLAAPPTARAKPRKRS
ncbi:MAG TPA: ATP-dependent helicase HrpB, partial [Candidatus Brocadiia bacterium]|nr:ATP-dependent helicase HrpB [Candidatus Brocadiia bacterium]